MTTTLVPEQSNQLTLRQISQNSLKSKHTRAHTCEGRDSISTKLYPFKTKRSFKLFMLTHWKPQQPNVSLISDVIDMANCKEMKIFIGSGLLELRKTLKGLQLLPCKTETSVSVDQPLPRWQKALLYSVILLPWVCELLPHDGTSIFHVQKVENQSAQEDGILRGEWTQAQVS